MLFIDNGVRTDNPLKGNDIMLINATAAPSVKGQVITTSTTVAGGYRAVPLDIPIPVGIVAESGVPVGIPTRIITNGIADVLFVGSTTMNNFARTMLTADAGAAEGLAIAETSPTTPFATDKHFMEIGHVSETRTGAGLAKVILHFN